MRIMWFWRSPVRLGASVLWNFCEFMGWRVPFAPVVFRLMIGARGRRIEDRKKHEET